MPGFARPRFVSPTAGWAVLTPVLVLVLGAAFLPLLLEGGPRVVVTHAFSAVCHQIPERSFALDGAHVALCHRCTGVLGGLALGLLVAPLLVPTASAAGRRLFGRVPGQHRAAFVLLLALVPLAADWLLGATGLWANTPVSRTATGALVGIVAGLLIGRALLAPTSRSLTLTST